ncbi:hypothetical protein SOPP22_15085 [Shewanella sp. OPT22]|nr:hypothetical protein SOPP22_15085 [Shewanella sp. OPT22]
MKYGKLALIIPATMAFMVAVAHLSCLYFGEQCYRAQMAPDFLVESARQGTWLAPVLNVIISALFIILGFYALSAAQIIRQLPLLRFVIIFVSVVSVIRGLLPIQLWIRKPELVSSVVLVVGVAWLLCGVFMYSGYRRLRKTQSLTSE